MKNQNKSNRAAADYFELLVCQYICHKYKVTFSYSKDLSELLDKTLNQEDGDKKILRQNKNFKKLKPKIIEILNFEITKKGLIKKVEWLGRNFVIKQTTSDVDSIHIKNKLTRFSIKSVGMGNGTQKNLGLGKLESFFDFSFKKEVDEMWKNLKYFLNNFKDSKKEMKNFCNKKENKNFLEFANGNGKNYQKKLNKIIFDKFNNSSDDKKLKFISFISDSEDEDLYVVVVNGKGVNIYKPIDKFNFNKNTKIYAGNLTDVGYEIFINEISIFRVQTNFTNGIGISAMCQRFFV